MNKGIIVLMGSGELTATMVEVHKEVLARISTSPKSVFLDTPAGFQLNADQLSNRAIEYFRSKVGVDMTVASFKSKEVTDFEAEESFKTLREADYVLVGPGSPTYAVRQWHDSPIQEILVKQVENGGCLVAASAAALTVGSFTMPVYEIYKVGHELHWIEGMNILGSFGMDYVVIPHWNNAEGGTHDTRCCFIGEERFKRLMSIVPGSPGILGIDEHTACIMDFSKDEAEIRGIGSITVRHGAWERIFQKGERFSLDILRGKEPEGAAPVAETNLQEDTQEAAELEEDRFWKLVHSMEDKFHSALEEQPRDAANAILELDRIIWKAQQDLENEEFISQAREVLRELVVLIGNRLHSLPRSREECVSPVVNEIVLLRKYFRERGQWHEADSVRDCMKRVGITVEDTVQGARWRLGS